MIISLPFHNNTLSFDSFPLQYADSSVMLQCTEEGKEHVKMWANIQDIRDAIVNLIERRTVSTQHSNAAMGLKAEA